jgi:type II secretory pathway component PulM
MAVIPAGAIKKEKEAGPLKKALDTLNTRERVMIGVLVVLVIVAVAAFLVVLPALDRISTVEGEIVILQEEKANIRVEPDHIPDYQAAYDAALRDYENYQHFYYPFMDPEVIDKTVTDMLLSDNLTPVRLAMTSVEQVAVPSYAALQTLVPRPVPAVEESSSSTGANGGTNSGTGTQGDGTGSGSGSGTDANGTAGTAGAAGTADGGSGENAADGQGGQDGQDDQQGRTAESASEAEAAAAPSSDTNPDAESAAAATSSIYCYTLDIEATGWMRDFFTFLERARGITAMEVVFYSYVDPEESDANSGQGYSSIKPSGNTVAPEEPEGGTIVMQIKLYVFIGGEMTTSDTTSS